MKRVALLGDSFIEAAQVPFEKTAGQLLQQSLNTSAEQSLEHSWDWEVLNFGISNYGVGQYLLTWEQYAKDYKPDYVVVFIATFHMSRTISKYEYGAFPASQSTALWVRPTFRVENDELIREPAKDFEKFVQVQEDLIKNEFAGERSRRKKMQLMTVYYAKPFWGRLIRLTQRPDHSPKQINTPAPPTTKIDSDNHLNLYTVNLKVLEELGQQVESAGSKLIVLDASQYFGENDDLSKILRKSCESNSFGYIPVYDNLSKANMKGVSTRWKNDGHFNEAGNEIVANALLDWIIQHSPQ